MLTADEIEEAEERRLAETELVKAAYSPDEACVVEGVENDGCCCTIVRHLHLSTISSASTYAVNVDLSIEMPENYPIREDAVLIVKGSLVSSPSNPPFIRKAALVAIPQLVGTCQQTAVEVAETQGGGEAVWSVLTRAEEWVDSDWGIILEEHSTYALANTATSMSKNKSPAETICTLGRRIIYSHHIIANSKRRDIADLTSQYKLGGYI